MNALSMPQLSRRRMLATSGALIVSFALSKRTPADEPPAAAAPPEVLPGSLAHTPMLDAWIKVDAAGRATVFTGKVELGQGLKTAVIQLAAEQLALAPEHIELVTADTDRTPNEGFTAGSHSMQDSGTAIFNAAGQVRALLMEAAAAQFGLPGRSTASSRRFRSCSRRPHPRLRTARRRTVAARERAARDRPRGSHDLSHRRNLAAAGRYSRQADRRRRLYPGHALARHAARAGRASAQPRGAVAERGRRRHRRDVRRRESCAGGRLSRRRRDTRMAGGQSVARTVELRAMERRREIAGTEFGAFHASDPAGARHRSAHLEGVRGRPRPAAAGALHKTVSHARVHRSFLRRGAIHRRGCDGLDAYAGRLPATRRARGIAGFAQGEGALHSRRGLRLLRPQRRR